MARKDLHAFATCTRGDNIWSLDDRLVRDVNPNNFSRAQVACIIHGIPRGILRADVAIARENRGTPRYKNFLRELRERQFCRMRDRKNRSRPEAIETEGLLLLTKGIMKGRGKEQKKWRDLFYFFAELCGKL